MTFNHIASAAALWVLSAFAWAHDYQLAELHIDHPWSREMPPVAPTAAVYFVLHNQGAGADRLLSASTPVAAKAELHQHVHHGNMMKMEQVESVALPAGAEVKFAPMDYHVMLFNVTEQHKDGEHFPLTLVFEKAGPVTIEVAVHQTAPGKAGHAHRH